MEYHDPFGVFPLVSRPIAARLPLRNLNWQSAFRPLRQIRSLHVDFVPDQATQSALRPDEPRAGGSTAPGLNSFDIVRSGRDAKKDTVKERRHQIPGLKTSPYLKLYVLRCDDKEAYKETERKQIREWIREHATSDGKRDNHDAFEWMILHVVVPDTVSASEPRWREASVSKDSEEPKERPKSSAKWPGKSTRTVFDRLRADFNESSKIGPDRIAQIRLRKDDVPANLLPALAVTSMLEETPQERENAWNDLMTKFKILLLGPFDLRVRQYEADIAQQEARRSLPGWNFCTFFIHKEGLAKALESIGLVEDALAIYDELAFGLETVVRDIASGQADGTATTFDAHTDDIEERITGSKAATASGEGHEKAPDRSAMGGSDLFNKDYREKIVRSSISVFDFFCYLFLRQKTLILRLANTRASQAALGVSGKEGGEDLVLISEVCWRASSFIHNNARTLRHDLSSGPGSESKQADIESLVCSWEYAVADQVLKETAASALDSSSAEAQPASSNGTPRRPVDFSFGMGANPYPQRGSSLPSHKVQLPDLKARTDGGNVALGSSQVGSTIELNAKPGIPGQPELAAYRAELLIVQRNMLEQLAERRNWFAGWAALKHAGKLEDVDLDVKNAEGETQNSTIASSLLAPILVPALESETNFHANFEYLSDLMMRHFAVATQTKTVQAIIADLAMLKSQQGDWESAVVYFQHVLPTLSTESWSLMDAEMHSAYTRCLRELDRKEEYMNAALVLLAKSSGRLMDTKLPKVRLSTLPDDGSLDLSGVFVEAVSCSRDLPGEVTRPMDQYFANIHLAREVLHHEDRDGFALRLRFRNTLGDGVKANRILARLVALEDPSQEIWLSSPDSVELVHGTVQVDLEVSAVAFGVFLIDKIVIEAEKLRFVQEVQPQPEVPKLMIANTELTSATNASTTAHRRSFVFLFPAAQSFGVEVTLSREMFIDRPRRIEFNIEAGWNEIEHFELKLRSLSAGLRLHLSDARYEGVTRRENNSGFTPGQICVQGLDAGASACISIPYTLEQQQSSISVRIEARYHTIKGSCTFLHSVKLLSELPLDVDVDDVFHLETLYSTFTVRSTNQMPISITGATLEESPAYAIEAPPRLALPMVVFDKQPARIAYKITPKKDSAHRKFSRKDAALALSVHYQSVEELVATRIRQTFVDSLRRGPFANLRRLLVPLLAERSMTCFTGADMALVALLNEFKVPSYEDMSWDDIIQTLPQMMQPNLTAWLQTWHSEHTRSNVERTDAGATTERCITIVVDVPNVDFVHSASLTWTGPTLPAGQTSNILPLGQAINAVLRLRHTDVWSARSVYKTPVSRTAEAKDEGKKFVFDMHAEPDTWLIGGQRRAHFTVQPGEERTFHLMLVPLRLGPCTLPTVDVQDEMPDSAAEGGPKPAPTVSCETHYESAGQLVHVFRDLRTARVHITEGGFAPPSIAASTSSGTGSVTSG